LLWLLLSGTLRGVSLGVDCLSDLHGGVLQSLEGLLYLLDVFGRDGLVQGGDVPVDLVLDVLRDLCRVLL
jgi:hypothetical protein